jgi:hypothetical protein
MRRLSLSIVAVFGVFLLLVLTGCGYDGSYRYPCQDPANWQLEECQPPICNASDTCTKDLLPEEDISNEPDTTQP